MSLLDDVSLMVTPNGVAESVLFGVLPEATLGAELISNGDFSNGTTDWTAVGNSTISVGTHKGRDNVAKINITATGTADRIKQDFAFVEGYMYKCVIDVYLENNSFRLDGSNTKFVGLNTFNVIAVDNPTGRWITLTGYGKALTTGTNDIWLRSTLEVSEFYVSNVSVKRLDTSDMDFTRATTATRNGFSVNTTINPTFDTTIDLGTAGSGWKGNTGGDSTVAYSNGGVKLTRVGSGASKLRVRDSGGSTSGMKIGSKYKLVYDVVENNGCSTLRYYNGATQTVVSDSIGTHTSYFTQTSTGTWQMENVTNDSNITLDNIYLYELLVEDVPRNLATDSQDLSGDTVNSSSVTLNATTAPDGTMTGNLITVGSGGTLCLRKNNVVEQNQEYTFSAYVKSSGGGVTKISMDISDDNVTQFVLTDEWQRVEMTGTSTKSPASSYHFVDMVASEGGSVGNTFYTWGWQVEKGSKSTAYIPTTDRLNVPRLDYTGGQCPHILVEPQRTNLFTYSEDFSNAAWTKQSAGTGSDPIVTANNVVSPDGTQNADKIVFNAGSGTTSSDQSQIIDSATFPDNTSGTVSIYLKGENGGEQITLRGVADLTYTLVTLTTEWQRFSTTENSGTNQDGITFGIRQDVSGHGVINSSATIYAWGAQLEEGGYKTSYIPTAGSTVTRNKDVFTRTGIADLIGTAGVLYLEVASIGSGVQETIALSDGTTDNRVIFYYTAGGEMAFQLKVGGSSVASGTVTGMTETDFHKIAIRYQDDSFQLFIDGVKKRDVSGTFTIPAFNRLAFDNGASSTTSDFEGKIRNIQVYKTALTEAKCISLTT